MDNIAPDDAKVNSAIAAVRQSWLEAVKAGDAEQIAAMVVDDVVVVHANGRCVRGKDALKADFIKAFEAYSIAQSVSNVEVIVRGTWAFEISAVETKLTPRSGGEATHVQSTTVVGLHQQPDGSWKVRRVLGLV
jgi:uncharacterized protein (TIGR02246 family)